MIIGSSQSALTSSIHTKLNAIQVGWKTGIKSNEFNQMFPQKRSKCCSWTVNSSENWFNCWLWKLMNLFWLWFNRNGSMFLIQLFMVGKWTQMGRNDQVQPIHIGSSSNFVQFAELCWIQRLVKCFSVYEESTWNQNDQISNLSYWSLVSIR